MKKREIPEVRCQCGRQYKNNDGRCENCTHDRYQEVWERAVYAPPTMRQTISGMIYGCVMLTLCISPAFALQAPIYGKASWYSSDEACGVKTNNHAGCPTASGKSLYWLENEGIDFVAMNNIKMGKKVRITNLANNLSVVAVVVDRGGFAKYGRVIDLGKKTFSKIAPLSEGVTMVKVEVL